MDKRLQQRLIGAAVLIALAVIFLPMLLSGGGSDHVSMKMKLPPEPDYHFSNSTPQPLPPATSQTVPSTVTALPAASTTAPPATANPMASVVQPVTPAPAMPQPAPQPPPVAPVEHERATPKPVIKAPAPPPSSVTMPAGKPVVSAWVVQVASFVDEHSAVVLRDRLRKGGFSSYIDRFPHAGKTYYRVRVGPRLSREKAEAMLGRIDKTVKLKGMLVPYP
ncbi:hypothetical protein BI364_05450 [Acidihalobacter yilgarnensis]|uniref:SPOR domain-containing protein n=1 Tax=Acidihalobacter yilgarnensis TaxID=2819280 RepID=A0A1D8IM12_9GAMM|nr:SPOR domain-containing protein [Acidihalobacter yilgarnensis]AOU97492.1 hypothetical protein BI364_05450 [Acidihalobacter yilgarnensis]